MPIKPIPKFLGQIRNGKLAVKDVPTYKKYLSTFKEGALVWLTVSEKKKPRSLSQNDYYWAYLRIIEAETGDFAEDLHEFFKRKFLPPRFVNVMGNEVKLPNSTTRLTTDEFSEYISKIERLTSIPSPNPEELYG